MRIPRPSPAVALWSVAASGAIGLALGVNSLRGQSNTMPAVVMTHEAGVDARSAGAGLRERDAGEVEVSMEEMDAAEPAASAQIDVEALVSLVSMKERDEASLAAAHSMLGPGKAHGNQGNPDITKHGITRASCLEGLRHVTLQTYMQHEVCGAPNEVPIYANGDLKSASVCIDVFEFPNKACVLPFVYTYSIIAQRLCSLDGKRLCTQEEWDVACEADPQGGPPRKYAYGDELDLTVCNTGKPWPPIGGPVCEIDRQLWKTCATNTEPTGSYPHCRSRLGVFDQHGNVAEAMTRKENGVNYVQLKGSAFFYEPHMYADHCRFDPRWHVDAVDQSWHTNYHLGFRCCRDVVPLKDRKTKPSTLPWPPASASASDSTDVPGPAPSDVPPEYGSAVPSSSASSPPSPSASAGDDD
jgi:sulfatase modifying factor 1